MAVFFALSFLLSILIPVAIIVGIVLLVRILAQRNGHNTKAVRSFGLREVTLGSLMIAAGFAGLSGFILLPYALFADDASNTKHILVALVSVVGLLVGGLALRGLTGKFLMIIGVLLLLGGFGPAFDSLDSSVTGLLAVLTAFGILIGVTIWVSRKGQGDGQNS